MTICLCFLFNPLRSFLYSSAGISCMLAALSNRTCKLADADDVKPLALLRRSSRNTSISNSAPSDRGWDLLSSVDRAIWLHKC